MSTHGRAKEDHSVSILFRKKIEKVRKDRKREKMEITDIESKRNINVKLI